MKSYRIVFRSGSNSPWTEVYSNNKSGIIADVFQHLCDQNRDDPEKHFRVQVLLFGEYQDIEI